MNRTLKGSEIIDIDIFMIWHQTTCKISGMEYVAWAKIKSNFLVVLVLIWIKTIFKFKFTTSWHNLKFFSDLYA